VTAAVGSAAGAGLPVLDVLATGIYFLVALGFPEVNQASAPVIDRGVGLAGPLSPTGTAGSGDILQHATAQGFVIHDVQAETISAAPDSESGQRMVEVTLHVHGKRRQ
jgi:putative Mg2+ transporter-C (MgtC) family protein